MTWSQVTSGGGSWSATTSGGAAWTDNTVSNTTARNTSRFVLLNDVADDSAGTLFPHFRETLETGRGAPFFLTEEDPIVLSDNSTAVV